AKMAVQTLALNPQATSPDHLFERHFTRKHGPGAYYGNPDRALPSPRRFASPVNSLRHRLTIDSAVTRSAAGAATSME
ncbi:MAG: hypothetical protein ABIR39_20975, partial [Nocardioides sp.]